jgi:hypothetical protein
VADVPFLGDRACLHCVMFHAAREFAAPKEPGGEQLAAAAISLLADVLLQLSPEAAQLTLETLPMIVAMRMSLLSGAGETRQ